MTFDEMQLSFLFLSDEQFRHLTFYLIETPCSSFAKRAGSDQAALVRAA